MVCTKTLYNYTDFGLLPLSNIDLPIKLRINTKPSRTRKHKKNLGKSIEEWMNALPRRILGYKTPEDLFESHLDVIYSI